MLDPALSSPERERLAALTVDWRHGYAGSIDGQVVGYPAQAAALASLEPLRPLGLATIGNALEPLRAAPTHRSEQVSEVRGGEWLTWLHEDGDWSLVQTEDDYVGWIAGWTLSAQTEAERASQLERRLGRYRGTRGTLHVSDHWAAGPLWWGAPLLAPQDGSRRREDFLLVELPNGSEGWIHAEECDTSPPAADPKHALRAGRGLLGTPYRWGGRSPGGLDCSGFVQLVCGWAGWFLPRDSSQQAACGDPIGLDRETWQPGDLLFFDDPATHVGFYDGKSSLLHCRGEVRLDALGAIEPLMARLSGVRRWPELLPSVSPSLWRFPAVPDRTP